VANRPQLLTIPDAKSPADSPCPGEASAERLVRRLSARYVFVLVAVALLIAADQAVIQPLLVRMNVFAPVVNLAGRQRMLSQKIAKAALALNATSDESAQSSRRQELEVALADWSASHDALRTGAMDRDIPRIQSLAIDRAWVELQPHVDAMRDAAERIASASSAPAPADLDALIAHEGPFLATMDRIVKLMEGEAARELRRLRILALTISLAIMGLLLGLGWFVVRPATRAIEDQVEQLEARVAARTRELGDALASLRHEVAERLEMEARNRTLATQLAHADRVESLGRLAAELAHEINQPLGAIANYAEACDAALAAPQDDGVRERLQGYLRQLRQAALRAGAIVRRIRNFAKPGEGNLAPVELTALVADVVELCRPHAARMDVEFVLDMPPREVVVAADAIQIQQVLVNLVQNALQALASQPPDGRRVAIRLATADDRVQVDVVDNGPGLADADPASLFEPFHTTKADGLGVGLSICRSIIEHHQGTIWAKSLPPSGAQFSFVVPLASAHVVQPAT
jgi:two-component system sensor kinase FixL